MTLVKMLETHPGSDDGLRVKMYMAGRIYNIGDDLLLNFLQMKCIEVVEDTQEIIEEKIDLKKAHEKTDEINNKQEIIEEAPKRSRGRPKKNA